MNFLVIHLVFGYLASGGFLKLLKSLAAASFDDVTNEAEDESDKQESDEDSHYSCNEEEQRRVADYVSTVQQLHESHSK
jgi:hypothetical protein